VNPDHPDRQLVPRRDWPKWLFDLVVAALGLLLLSPLLVGFGLLVKLDSPGPVFHRGVRTGWMGETFRIFKFRTMYVGSENTGGLSTGRNDARVTRFGRFLRRYKLDELPQLLNVLKGEMSLVGPRPEMPEYTALYEGDERLILTVRPGITDFASLEFSNLGEVLGDEEVDQKYEEEVMPIKNALRVKYVRERGFRTDLRLLCRTVLKVFGGS
jgi:lipopolysaccharide/colanic/teichoic acid biosynthesis glycosyltransferase